MSARVMEEPPAERPGMPTVVHCPVAPPKDRGFWLVANIAYERMDEDGHHDGRVVDPYEGYAVWKEQARDWVDLHGMSIRQLFGAEMHILSWMELSDRAHQCPESETQTSANIYCWEDESRRASGRNGFFAVLVVYHLPTMHRIKDYETRGPFPSRAEAAIALARMIDAPWWPEPNAGGQG